MAIRLPSHRPSGRPWRPAARAAGLAALALAGGSAVAAEPEGAMRGLRASLAAGEPALGLRLVRDPAPLALPGAARLEATWPLAGGRDELRGTIGAWAPSGSDSGEAAQAFGLATGAATGLSARRADPARITWRRAWVDAPELKLRLGVTARARDPGLMLTPGPMIGGRGESGFVPLLHASLEQRLGERFSLLADFDAGSAAWSGRATLDADVRLRYEFTRDFAGTVSYRLLDAAAAVRDPALASRDAFGAGRAQSLSLGLQYRW